MELPVIPPGEAWELVGVAVAAGKVVECGSSAIELSGIADGTSEGKPTIAFAVKLPDGKVAFAETTWRLFAFAFWAFAGYFGEERPSLEGMTVQHGLVGGGKVSLDVLPDDHPEAQHLDCAIPGCGEKVMLGDYLVKPETASKELQAAAYGEMLGWLHRHVRENHPDVETVR